MNRLLDAALGSVDIAAAYLGDRLGLYRALAEAGPLSPADLAGRTGIHERYAREWLEQQATSGFVEVEDNAEPEQRRYALPPAHAAALVDPDSQYSMAPLARAFVAAISSSEIRRWICSFRGGLAPCQHHTVEDEL